MVITQAYAYVNDAIKQITGQEGVLQQDYSNLIDIGKTIENAIGYDHFAGALVDRIVKTRFADDDRQYNGVMPDVRRDGAEYGSILQTIWVEYPEASENEAYKLTNGTVYEQDDFTGTVVHAKYYNHRNTFKHKVSIARRQVKEAFANETALNAFIGYIFSNVETMITMDLDELTRTMFKDFIGETLYKDFSGGSLSAGSHNMGVNLLYLYNNGPNAGQTALTAANCLYSKEFIIFANEQMAKYKSKLAGMSTLFNIQGRMTYTPESKQKWVFLNDYVQAARFHGYSDTFNYEFIKSPADAGSATSIVPYWQGSGTDFSFTNVSKIHGITAENHTVEAGGILATLYDVDAMMIWQSDRYGDTHHNATAQFDNYYYFAEENDTINYWYPFIVFFVA